MAVVRVSNMKIFRSPRVRSEPATTFKEYKSQTFFTTQLDTL